MPCKKSKLALSELVGMISDRSRAHYIARIHKKKSIEEKDGKERFYRRYIKCEPGTLLQEREGSSKRNGGADNYHVLDTLAFYIFVYICLFYFM